MNASARWALAAFVTGAAVMLVFDAPIARIAGVALLVAAIATAVVAIATPSFVARDEETEP